MSDPFAMFRLLERIVILGLLHGVYIYIHVCVIRIQYCGLYSGLESLYLRGPALWRPSLQPKSASRGTLKGYSSGPKSGEVLAVYVLSIAF